MPTYPIPGRYKIPLWDFGSGLNFGSPVDCFDTGAMPVSPYDYGAAGNGSTDDTVAVQNAYNRATSVGGVLVIPPGTFKCGQITDTTTGRVQIQGTPGGVIAPTTATWLKVVPGSAGSKNGFVMRDVVFSIANGADNTPVVWLEGSSSGGVQQFLLENIDFGDLTSVACDLIWIRAGFNGMVRGIWGKNASRCRAVMFCARNFNSGNVTFDTIEVASAAVMLQLGQAFNSSTNQNLLNNIVGVNLKAVRSSLTTGAYNPVTLTAQANPNDTTLTVSVADATAISNALTAGTPQFAVLASTTLFGDTIRITAANTTTGVITLAAACPITIAVNTVIAVGTFGTITSPNTRSVTLINPHHESVGFGLCCAGGQAIRVLNALSPTPVSPLVARLLYAINGAQDIQLVNPIYSLGATGLTLAEVTGQGTQTDIDILQPTPYASGAGPVSLLTSAAGAGNRIRLRQKVQQCSLAITYGATVTPDESADSNTVTVTDANAFTVAAPINRYSGAILTLDIFNNSGGVMGAVTFNAAIKLAGAFVAPATGNHRQIILRDDGTNIHEIARSAADVPN